VRFDQGYIGRVSWAFNILNAVRFDLSLNPPVRDRFLAQPDGHTGAGFRSTSSGLG
jgi:hypothetical protein